MASPVENQGPVQTDEPSKPIRSYVDYQARYFPSSGSDAGDSAIESPFDFGVNAAREAVASVLPARKAQ